MLGGRALTQVRLHGCFQSRKSGPAVLANAFNSAVGKQRQAISESEASLVYITSSETASIA